LTAEYVVPTKGGSVNKIGIIGIGNMGEAIIRALLASGTDEEDIVCFDIKPEKVQALRGSRKVTIARSAKDLVKRCTKIVLAVKPQDAEVAVKELASEMDEPKILISIMAGVTISNIMSIIGKPIKLVRVMPNICVTVGEGVLGIAPNNMLAEDELKSVETLLVPLGCVVRLSEEHLDAITALGGSGPAFVLAFLEALIDGAVKMGLTRDNARKIAIQTIKGTVAMLEEEALHPTLLKERITSPGGTTIAGLVILDEKGFKGTVIRCLEAAQTRSRELSK
jgi:pyrroline-5-carboxylate reductase